MVSKTDALNFKVSTGLKNVLGSRLITDDEVAVFELVKNSFDAGATRVELFFDEDKFVIADNGEGISKDDIENKWLFVAYSNKRAGKRSTDYRSQISSRRQVAGSKGIGRFSSDRLGAQVTLQSKPKKDVKSPVHQLKMDWDKFDVDQIERFTDIDLDYQAVDNFVQPKEFKFHKF
ncbi:MAG: ATP-binding protein [Candidatus Puniceispirillales bacterium]